jgi:hypothetical protein
MPGLQQVSRTPERRRRDRHRAPEGHADPHEAARGPVHGAEPGQSAGGRRLISIGGRKTAPRLFISYSHADKKFVSDLYDQLRAAKVDLWLDQHELLPGMEITASVEGGLRDCDGLICVLSKNSTQSKWLSFEGTLFYASGREKTLIPVILDEQGKDEAGKLPFLRDRLFVDFSATADKAAALQHLNEAIRKTKT